MMMNIIDTHCHLDLEIFDSDRESLIERCVQLGINRIIVPGIESNSWDNLISICQNHDNLLPALGLHPVFINSHTIEDITKLEQLINDAKPVAIGEIGLDFYISDTDRDKQIEYFNLQLDLASKYQLPIILHVRKAHDEVLKLLKSKQLTGGSCHAFSGSLQQAKQYIGLGFKLGFGGTLTYPNAKRIHELARQLPLNSIILETDAPDMSGFNHKGERNQPDFIIDALEVLASLKELSIEEVAKQTTINATEVFNL